MDVTLILVTLLSLALAAVMTTLAWRLAREERRRSDARVAMLAAEIRGGRDGVQRGAAARGVEHDLPLHHRATVVQSRDLFEAQQRPEPQSRAGTALVTAAIVLAGVATVGYVAPHWSVASGVSRTSAAARISRQTQAPAVAVPLELTALTDERDGDRLTVRGVVRNPEGGGDVRGLTAVVSLFGQDGGFVTSGRATVAALAPGAESPFLVTIPNAAGAGRYRVSFRTDDRIVPHVDRRDRSMARAR